MAMISDQMGCRAIQARARVAAHASLNGSVVAIDHRHLTSPNLLRQLPKPGRVNMFDSLIFARGGRTAATPG